MTNAAELQQVAAEKKGELQQVATEKKAAAFEVASHYERLIELRERSPDEFMLQTSAATRYALACYEKARHAHVEREG